MKRVDLAPSLAIRVGAPRVGRSVPENAGAALDWLAPRSASQRTPTPTVVLVFSGHRLDARGRKAERFPARAEDLARRMIRDKLAESKSQRVEPIVGYAGCASGGDISFYEVCDELTIPTTGLLAGSPTDYLRESMHDAGSDRVQRFHAIRNV